MDWEPIYISILKNVRGVVYFDKNEEISKEIKWLSRHFRYRYLGIGKELFKNIKSEDIKLTLSKNPFIQLSYPSKFTEEFISSLANISGMNKILIESLLLSSCYVSPIFITGNKALKECEPLILHSLKTLSKLNDRELKFHLRVADYGVIDLHRKTTMEGWDKIKKASHYILTNKFSDAIKILESLIKERKKTAVKDCEKRYWRLISEKKEGKIKTVVYMDPCLIIQKSFKNEQKALELSKLILNSIPEISINFALITGFFISI
jgi:hypothetical protein